MEPEIMDTQVEQVQEAPQEDKRVDIEYGVAVYLDKEGNLGYTFLGDKSASLHEVDGLVKYLERALDKRWEGLL